VIPYRARPVWRDYHESDARWRVVVAHRRAGKTVAALNELIRTALTCGKPNPRCAYVAPYLGQAKAVAWDHLKRFTAPISGVRWNEAELRCDLPNGGRIRLFGADNADALRGLYLDEVDCDEFGDWDPRAWAEVIRPALSDRQGRATFTGTPRGKNGFFELRQRAARGEPGWALWELRASRTGLLSDAELADARASMDEAAYAREYECSFDASVEGAYYAAELSKLEAEGRVCRVPVEPTVRVDTWWDLGIDDATAIWFVQDVGPERRIIDYLEVSGEGLPQIVKRLEAKDHRYGRHVLPHDARARELGTGVSRVETLQALGLREIEVVGAQTVADGINAVRLMLSKCWLDGERCARGIEALKQYRREWVVEPGLPAAFRGRRREPVGERRQLVLDRAGICPARRRPDRRRPAAGSIAADLDDPEPLRGDLRRAGEPGLAVRQGRRPVRAGGAERRRGAGLHRLLDQPGSTVPRLFPGRGGDPAGLPDPRGLRRQPGGQPGRQDLRFHHRRVRRGAVGLSRHP
jgi:phage terminase large subunit